MPGNQLATVLVPRKIVFWTYLFQGSFLLQLFLGPFKRGYVGQDLINKASVLHSYGHFF